MPFLLFALTYPFIWLFSKLPMRILYIKSDFFFFLIYYVFKYRKKVVLENLNLVFPKKTEKEKEKIARQFFKHLTDLLVESIKLFTISEKEISKRYKFKNPEILDNYKNSGRSIALVGAHQANWEWSCSMPLATKITCYGAYTKLNNKYFERVIKNTREKFGFIGFKTSNTVKGIQQNFNNNIQGLYLLLSDQSPQPHKTFYWNSFFGIKVPLHTGAEMLAKRFDMVVINYITKKIKRGYYEVEFQLITDAPRDFEDYRITDLYTKLTEENIKKQPQFYLWSHKRFKHRHGFEEWKKMKIASKKKTN